LTQIQDITSPMTRSEKRAVLSLAGIYALRMLGLFMILPVLSLFAERLEGSTPVLMGLAVSIYGLTQAVLQIPFGMISDHVRRKAVIIIGLLLFASGSVVAALSKTIYGVLAGRALQGSGAISAAVMALVADLTQEVHRTKAMALIGATIGLSFGAAMTLGPVIAGFAGVPGIFWFTAILALLAIAVIVFWVPEPQISKVHRDAEYVPAQFKQVWFNADLLRLNFGIFALHLMLTASFVVVPLLMRDAGLASKQHWQVYLPVLVTSMAAIIPFIILAEKKRQMKPVFMGAILTLSIANLALRQYQHDLTGIIASLWVFFCGFNLLEATLPSLISKTAPGNFRGTAMGVYSTSQFLGAFVGGAMGGWLYGNLDTGAVFLGSAVVALCWLLVAASMKPPRYLANLLLPLHNVPRERLAAFADALLALNGVVEVSLQKDEEVAYLKVDNNLVDKGRLQALLQEWSTVS
jgi:predicted MFS family arabinose efflux permease